MDLKLGTTKIYVYNYEHMYDVHMYISKILLLHRAKKHRARSRLERCMGTQQAHFRD